jgi:protein SCO1/2
MKYLFFAPILVLFASCGSEVLEDEHPADTYVPLPYIGQHDVEMVIRNGVEQMDTIYHVVPPFVLMDQDSQLVTNDLVKGKIYVANFFFTSCPAICPAMIEQMKRFQGLTNDIEELVILSHTIDPERDSIPKLRQYIADREIDTRNWHFLYGARSYVHDLGKQGYMVNAMEDEKAEGGFLHSEHFVLIDREGHVRGLYTGTDTEDVNRLNDDIRKLIANEYK